jgi:hypothetical protein
MSGRSYNAVLPNRIRRVYYSGTDTLQEGYALCYKHDATDPNTTNPEQSMGFNVVKPATANLALFAGVVAPSSAGITGPAFIDIIEPSRGELVRASLKVNATALVTIVGPANNSYSLAAVPSDATSATTIDASQLKQVGVPTVTADTSTTAAIGTVKFL